MYVGAPSHNAHPPLRVSANVKSGASPPLGGSQHDGLSRQCSACASIDNGVVSYAGRYDRWLTDRASRSIEAYTRIAADAGCTPMQLAYAFCKSRSFVTSTIIGATTLEQLAENIDAFAVDLPAGILEAIDDVHREHRNPSLYD